MVWISGQEDGKVGDWIKSVRDLDVYKLAFDCRLGFKPKNSFVSGLSCKISAIYCLLNK